jgi:hypothetical protein
MAAFFIGQPGYCEAAERVIAEVQTEILLKLLQVNF